MAPHPSAPLPCPPAVPQPAHATVVCVAAPALAISPEDGQLRARGLDGFYQDGLRALARCEVRLAGAEPLAVEGGTSGAGSARFTAVARVPGDPDPDPALSVERVRHAEGVERVTVRNAGPRPVRLPLEVTLGTDLFALAAVASGRPGPELPCRVHGSGLRWSAAWAEAGVAARPAPDAALSSAGLLRWDLVVPPGASRTVELRVSCHRARPARRVAPPTRGKRPESRVPAPRAEHAAPPWSVVRSACDEPSADALLRTSVEDLGGLLLRETAWPGDVHLASGVPWRFGLSPADGLWAARLLLPLGTRLAGGTLRTLARLSRARRPDAGQAPIPGPLRQAGPGLPPASTGTEATLLFVTVLAEARRWGMPEREAAALLPVAEACLGWLRTALGDRGYVPDPAAGGPFRAEVQAHAHRAALHGAELLDAFGRPCAGEWRERAAALRDRFRADFWPADGHGGRPAAALLRDGRPVGALGSAAAHLLDTGLLGGGRLAEGLLDKAQTEQLARLLGAPDMDCGWGLRSRSARDPSFNPFGHRSGAVRVHDSALAVAGLAAAGFEREAAALLRGVLAAAEAFGYRLPEMYAGEQRSAGRRPLPHPTACRPAAVAAAAAVHLLLTPAGVRPDAPEGLVALRPMATAPLGAARFTGLSVAGRPFGLRVSRLGMAVIEEAAPGLQLGA